MHSPRALALAFLIAVLPTRFAAAADPNAELAAALVTRELPAIAKAIDRGANVNLAAPDGRTALMIAAGAGDARLVQRLIGAGVDVNARNDRGGTALMYAAVAGDSEALDLLLSRGAMPDLQGKNGWTALMLAAARGHTDTARRLLTRGADPNVPDIYGWTPLMRAVHEQREAVAQVLLAHRATALDARDEAGNSALHHAAAQGAVAIARQLLARGADPNWKDGRQRTPAEVARLAGHADVAVLIERATKK